MNPLISVIGDTLWFFLPAIAANMAPVLAAHYGWLPRLALPLDGGRTIRGRRLLGEHKTVRGLVVGVVFSVAVGALQSSPLTGAALGLGALLGDAAKSLLKRQLNIPPGHPWPPLDQVDFVLGALLLGGWFLPLTFAHVLLAPVILGLGSYAVSVLGVRLRVKKSL